MQIVAKTVNKKVATVYIAEMDNGKFIEFVESIQPPIPREEKWVLIISTLYGCPVGCRFCDAGGHYQGKLSKEELISQIDFLIKSRFPDRKVPVKKFKIQFARMGDPALNPNVLDVLEELPQLYEIDGFMPSISTVAPQNRDNFFDRLLKIKKNRYYQGKFQFQFSIHTTDESLKKWLVPTKTWDFGKMAQYGETFYSKGDRKIALNFALADGMPVNPNIILKYFDPDIFLIKITPVNPTYRAKENKISSHILSEKTKYKVIEALREAGYDVILSIGELIENDIGSNCGQYLTTFLKNKDVSIGGYNESGIIWLRSLNG
ncbi:MAG: radical SAM protein [Candidatus Cloacimonetes bacterium 4572_55]|nr:MAG: radical SAM protein [Candidatus Cloacimonetes bacterium 4572_55]